MNDLVETCQGSTIQIFELPGADKSACSFRQAILVHKALNQVALKYSGPPASQKIELVSKEVKFTWNTGKNLAVVKQKCSGVVCAS